MSYLPVGINKDIAVKIALLLDLPEILTLCRLNNKFNRFVCKNKDFWISRLKQDFGIKYLDIKGTNHPLEYYKWAKIHSSTQDDLNMALMLAAAGGHPDLINLTIKLGANNFDEVMITSIISGNTEILYMMISEGADAEFGLDVAITNGNIDMVDRLINVLRWQNKLIPYDDIMLAGAREGHVDIVNMAIEIGASDYDGAMEEAIENEHIDVVEMLLIKASDDIDIDLDIAEAIDIAETYGYDDIINLLYRY